MELILKINTMKINELRLVIPDLDNNQHFLVSKADVILDWNRSNYLLLTIFIN